MCVYIKYSIYLYNARKRPDCKIDWKIELTRKIVCVRSGGLNKLQQRDTKSKIQAALSWIFAGNSEASGSNTSSPMSWPWSTKNCLKYLEIWCGRHCKL